MILWTQAAYTDFAVAVGRLDGINTAEPRGVEVERAVRRWPRSDAPPSHGLSMTALPYFAIRKVSEERGSALPALWRNCALSECEGALKIYAMKALHQGGVSALLPHPFERIRELILRTYWTPEMAAMLLWGLDPENDSQEIPDTAVSLWEPGRAATAAELAGARRAVSALAALPGPSAELLANHPKLRGKIRRSKVTDFMLTEVARDYLDPELAGVFLSAMSETMKRWRQKTPRDFEDPGRDAEVIPSVTVRGSTPGNKSPVEPLFQEARKNLAGQLSFVTDAVYEECVRLAQEDGRRYPGLELKVKDRKVHYATSNGVYLVYEKSSVTKRLRREVEKARKSTAG